MRKPLLPGSGRIAQCILFLPFLLCLLFLLPGCPFGGNYKYSHGTFPVNPVNLEEINSTWDDYNATAPTMGEGFPFCFSSNRNSAGKNFDLVYRFMTIEFSKFTGELRVYEGAEGWKEKMARHANVAHALELVNSEFDELGPGLYPMEELTRQDPRDSFRNLTPHILLFSSDIKGSQDLFYTQNLLQDGYAEPIALDFMNSDADDTYPCFGLDRSRIYFCSDREGGFDIYYAEPDPGQEILDILGSGGEFPIIKETILCSDGDDKCPLLVYNLMVFASDRPGGYGGFDLYFSEWDGERWGEPVNFGPAINSEHDEYRPVVRPQWDAFTNDFMIFSSNRPGGLGGFDLYYAGIPEVQQPLY